MPLVKGSKAKTKSGISENIRREVRGGKKQKVASAITYSVARKTKGKDK